MRQPKRHRDEKASSLISHFAAEYFEIEANKNCLITITRSEILNKGKRALIYFTTLPREKEKDALDFMKRKRNDFRQFVIAKKSFGFAPKIDFCLDLGEYNRQRIDELLNQ